MTVAPQPREGIMNPVDECQPDQECMLMKDGESFDPRQCEPRLTGHYTPAGSWTV